jgi:cobalt/nickel transport protein
MRQVKNTMTKKEVVFGLMLAVLLSLLLSPFASPWPDGLERVAKDKGFLEKSEGRPKLTSPFHDYVCPGIKNGRLATSVAGVAGTLVMFAVGYGIAVILRKRKG